MHNSALYWKVFTTLYINILLSFFWFVKVAHIDSYRAVRIMQWGNNYYILVILPIFDDFWKSCEIQYARIKAVDFANIFCPIALFARILKKKMWNAILCKNWNRPFSNLWFQCAGRPPLTIGNLTRFCKTFCKISWNPICKNWTRRFRKGFGPIA